MYHRLWSLLASFGVRRDWGERGGCCTVPGDVTYVTSLSITVPNRSRIQWLFELVGWRRTSCVQSYPSSTPPPPGASFTVNIKLSTFQCKIIYKNSSNKDGNVIIIQRRRSKFDNGMQCLFVCLQQESSTKAAVGVGGVCSPWGTLGWKTAPLCGCILGFHGRRRVIFGYNNDQIIYSRFLLSCWIQYFFTFC